MDASWRGASPGRIKEPLPIWFGSMGAGPDGEFDLWFMDATAGRDTGDITHRFEYIIGGQERLVLHFPQFVCDPRLIWHCWHLCKVGFAHHHSGCASCLVVGRAHPTFLLRALRASVVSSTTSAA